MDQPALIMDFLHEVRTNVARVVEAGPAHKKSTFSTFALEAVKKVLIWDKHTFEAWYRLPQFPGVRILTDLVPRKRQYAKQKRIGKRPKPLQQSFRVLQIKPPRYKLLHI